MTALPITYTVPEPVPARLVTRISEDPKDTRSGVDRQLKLGLELAARLNWPIEREHRDNNRSGWKYGVYREAYEELLADIRAGLVRAVICWDQDRITRQSEQWHEFRRLCKRHGVRFATVTEGGEVPIGTVTGGFSTGVRALLAEGESEIKSERIKAASEERVLRKGKVNGRVLYGWARRVEFDSRGNRLAWYDVPSPDQAAVVREMVDRIIAGDTLQAICRDLDARGVPTPSVAAQWSNPTRRWTVSTVRTLVQRPANVGRIQWHGTVVEGQAAEAPGIVDEAKWRKACAVLADPERRVATDNRVKNLLSGVAVCDACGGDLRFKTMRRRYWEQASYTCKASGHVTIAADLADAAVHALAVKVLAGLRMADLTPSGQGSAVAAAAAEVERLSDDKRELLALAGSIKAADLVRALGELDAKLDAASRAARVPGSGPGVAAALTVAQAADPAEAWHSLPLTTQRQVLLDVLEVRLTRALAAGGRGKAADYSGRRDDPRRLVIRVREA